ncbi:hypothetical protein EDB85DRAFT_2067722, partial [Lactarius pseudohatsudake]
MPRKLKVTWLWGASAMRGRVLAQHQVYPRREHAMQDYLVKHEHEPNCLLPSTSAPIPPGPAASSVRVKLVAG